MENLAIFYRMLNGDLAPLSNSLSHSEYSDFLQSRFPDFDRQLVVSLEKKGQNYEIKNLKEFCFSDIIPFTNQPPVLPNEDHPALEFICNHFNFVKQSVKHWYLAEDDEYVSLELLVADRYDNLSASQAKFYYYQVLCHETLTAIREKLTGSFLEQKDSEIKSFVRKYQSLINGYIQTLLHDLIPTKEHSLLFQLSGSYILTDIYKIVYQSLDDILFFLEKSFGKYLDEAFPVPYKTRLLIAATHTTLLGKVLNELEWAHLDFALHEIIITPFHRLGRLEPITMSYRHQQYDLAYLNSFYEVVVEDKPLDYKQVLLILWRMNYNSLKFFNYLTRKITRELRAKETIEEKLERLYYYQKLGNQLPLKTQLSFNPQLLPLKDQLVVWLQEEINYQKKKAKYIQNGALSETAEDKRQLKMSVAQLSLLVRAFYETGLVEGSRHELLQFISRHYRTDQQENISFGSLKGKYYKIDTGTKRAVGRMMKRMLSHIENAGKVS